MKKIVGWAMLGLLSVALTVVLVLAYGWVYVLIAYGISALVVGIVLGAVCLIFDE